ncbi:MAG: hypothetical protein AAF363_14440 [Bacteroidota bacterium]
MSNEKLGKWKLKPEQKMQVLQYYLQKGMVPGKAYLEDLKKKGYKITVVN